MSTSSIPSGSTQLNEQKGEDVSQTTSKFVSRRTDKKILSREQGEGVGARVRRSIGRQELRNLDPFLMLDEFRVGKPAGFPKHPHRGFETVTYILPSSRGSFRHQDFVGHKGDLTPGGVQWMTAGRGIMHSEMPLSEEEAHGLQLWVNLPRKDKMTKPRYQELKPDEVTEAKKDGVFARVIAGEALGEKSSIFTTTPTEYIHFTLEAGAELEQPVPAGWTAFAYTLDGEVVFGSDEKATPAHYTVTFEKDKKATGVRAVAGKKGASFVLIAGEPIGEPIYQWGPVVMSSEKECLEAFDDIRQGRNGFEAARGWNPKYN